LRVETAPLNPFDAIEPLGHNLHRLQAVVNQYEPSAKLQSRNARRPASGEEVQNNLPWA
jgi:hypothetical protein